MRLTQVPGRIWEIVLKVAAQMPYVGLLAFIGWQLDQRNEEGRAAYISEIKSSRDMMTGVVNSATKAMEAVVKDSDENKKLITEILSLLPRAPKKLGE